MKMTTTPFACFTILACFTTALLGVGLWAASASAAPFDIETKLTASDAAALDRFGWSVAISGNTALVGAWRDDDGGSDSGSAYLFDTTTGSQIAKLTASDAAAHDQFGESVAISGNTALVGAWRDDHGGDDSGSAYLFDITTGNELAKLTATDTAANDQFGRSVAISGNTALVGASFDDDGGGTSGSAYLFDVTTGNELFKLTASDAAADDQFGDSVALSGNTALVGTQFDDDAGSFSGSAYLYSGVPGIEGDFNNNGILDAADYTVWLDNLGNPAGLPNDNNLGTVGQSHYDLWKTNFGMSDANGSVSAAIPEPATGIMLMLGMGAVLIRGWVAERQEAIEKGFSRQ